VGRAIAQPPRRASASSISRVMACRIFSRGLGCPPERDPQPSQGGDHPQAKLSIARGPSGVERGPALLAGDGPEDAGHREAGATRGLGIGEEGRDERHDLGADRDERRARAALGPWGRPARGRDRDRARCRRPRAPPRPPRAGPRRPDRPAALAGAGPLRCPGRRGRASRPCAPPDRFRRSRP
jgi:hypothetical protein